MTTEEIRLADKFAEEHVMYLCGGDYYAVNITDRFTGKDEEDINAPCFYATNDNGDYAFFHCSDIEAKFPHIK